MACELLAEEALDLALPGRGSCTQTGSGSDDLQTNFKEGALVLRDEWL